MTGSAGGGLLALRGLAGGVHGFAHLHRRLRQSLRLLPDGVGVFAVQSRLHIGLGRLDRRLVGFGDLVAEFGQGLLGGVDQGFGLVLGLDQFLALLVLGRVGLGVLDHLFDVGVRQAAVGLDADRLLLGGRLVLGR